MAVSIGSQRPNHWTSAAEIAARLVDYLSGCAPRTSLNLNVPDVPLDQIRGLRSASVRSGGSKRLVLSGTAPGPLTINWSERQQPATVTQNDAELVDAGYAVLTRVLAPPTTEPEPFPDDAKFV